jgi:hypothetical protein
MYDQRLEIGRKYLLKHTTQTVQATVDRIRYRLDINTLDKKTASGLDLNDIGAVVLETQKPLFVDPYRRNRGTGSFILIDPITNATVAAGMITGREPEKNSLAAAAEKFTVPSHRITRSEQQFRAGHRAFTVWLETSAEVVYAVEQRLFDANCRVLAVVDRGAAVPDISRALNDAGVIAVIWGSNDPPLREETRHAVGEDGFLYIASATSDNVHTAADRIWDDLVRQRLVLAAAEGD